MLNSRTWSAVLVILMVIFTRSGAAAYEQMGENDHLILYVQKDNLAIRVKDKATGYTWSSVIEELVPRENNRSWENFMSSGLAVEYYEENRTRLIRTDLVSAQDVEIDLTPKEQGFSAQVFFSSLGIHLELQVKLEENQVVVHIPHDSIVEEGTVRLASIYVYPFLGAVRKGELPGYLFVPDGVGALVDFADNKNKFNVPYEARIFGDNEGLTSTTASEIVKPPYTVKAPVFGLFHDSEEHGAHGIFAVIEEGQYNARLLAYPNGVVTQYNWITAKFHVRETYLQPTSKTMGGIIVYEKRPNPESIQVRYFFSHGKESDYVGMAQTYQTYLVKQGILTPKQLVRDNTPIRLDILGAETENGLFSKRLVPMTTFEQALEMVNEIQSLTGGELMVILQGWNKGGLSGTSPYEIRFEGGLGGKRGFQELVSSQSELYLYTDYGVGYGEAKRFSIRSDAARRLNKTTIELPTMKEVYDRFYLLTPQRTKEIVSEDIPLYKKERIQRLAVDKMSYTLFSHARRDEVTSRKESAQYYQEALDLLKDEMESVVLYEPNAYLWGAADAFLDIPMHSSQFAYFGETVPFLPMVLRGYLDYYGPYANFFANQRLEMLRLVEYGAFPSYYLTYEPSYKLKYTNSNDLFTSTYEDWRDVIVEHYALTNPVLKQVDGARIVDHYELAEGITAVEYSNEKVILVNYTENDYVHRSLVIPSQGFLVRGVSEL